MTLTKRFVSLCVALALMFSMLTINAAAANASNGLNISYRMDGENVVETIVFPDATMIRTIAPNGVMTIKTIEDGSVSTSELKADYKLYKKIYESQYSVVPAGSEITGSQYKHHYVGTPGPVTITRQEIIQCRTAASLAKVILGESSISAFVAFSVAEYMLKKAVDTSTYERVVVNSLTYEVLFVHDNSYYTHCYHQTLSYYNSGASTPFLTETDYYQAVGG